MPRPRGLPKTGGRQKGVVDKIKREAILAAQGITPLDYLMMLVRAELRPVLIPLLPKHVRPYASKQRRQRLLMSMRDYRP